MKTKSEIASQDYMGNLNCAQSTIALFTEKYGLDEKAAMRLCAAFGGGCHYGEVCGAVLGGCAVVGLKYGNDEPDPVKYLVCREKTRDFLAIVKEKYGTLRCSDLLGIDMTDPDGRAKSKEQGSTDKICRPIVAFIVETLEELGY